MSLFDDLVNAGKQLPPSHVPSAHDLPGLVGAIVAFGEHGETFLKAAEAGVDEVASFLGGGTTAPADTVPSSDGLTVEERATLESLQAKIADSQKATVTTEPAPTVEPVQPQTQTLPPAA
jgi:hypothetical protein